MSITYYLGKTFTNVLIEDFYLKRKFVSIVRLYLEGADTYFSITCGEENVIIREQKERPKNAVSGDFEYVIVEQSIDWLKNATLTSIKYLIDNFGIRRGVAFFFDGNHNFVFYNKGYEIEDTDFFDLNINPLSLDYQLIDM